MLVFFHPTETKTALKNAPFFRLKTFFLTLVSITMVHAFSYSTATQSKDNFNAHIPHSGQSIFDQFQAQEIVEMTLTAKLDTLINVRNTMEYSRAELSYEDEFGIRQNYRIKVRPRGKFRRRTCDMPPLKLKISKKQLEAAGLSKHNDLKLVTHCLDDEKYSESLVLREYLAYQLYNELTPYSFRVQLARITYQDSEDPGYKITQYGFLIEDTDELVARMEGKECEDCFGLPVEKYRASSERIAAVFQFMIGNADWSTQMSRNVKQVEMSDGSIVPVPYDFDFSVMVSAPYLRPNASLGQTAEMERVFLGHAGSVKEIYSTLSYFKTKRRRLLEIVKDFDRLSWDDRQRIKLYLESFFKQIYNRDSAEDFFFGKNKIPVK